MTPALPHPSPSRPVQIQQPLSLNQHSTDYCTLPCVGGQKRPEPPPLPRYVVSRSAPVLRVRTHAPFCSLLAIGTYKGSRARKRFAGCAVRLACRGSGGSTDYGCWGGQRGRVRAAPLSTKRPAGPGGERAPVRATQGRGRGCPIRFSGAAKAPVGRARRGGEGAGAFILRDVFRERACMQGDPVRCCCRGSRWPSIALGTRELA